MTLTGKVGRFFVIFGVVLVVIFFISDLADDPQFNLFFASLVILFLGIIMMRRGRLPAESSGRFRLVQSMRNRGRRKKTGGGSPPGGEGT